MRAGDAARGAFYRGPLPVDELVFSARSSEPDCKAGCGEHVEPTLIGWRLLVPPHPVPRVGQER